MEKLQPILGKLKGALDHLEKIILGIVLVAVAVISVKMLLGAKGELIDVSKATEITTLGGTLSKPNDISSLSNLVRVSSDDPPSIDLVGDNHSVFNAAKWNKIVTNSIVNGKTVSVTNLVRDSVTRPLGISALRVEGIKEIILKITPKIQFNRSPAKLGDNNMRYTFEAEDEYPSRHMSVPEFMAFKRGVRHSYYAGRAVDTVRMRSFLPQIRPFGGKKALSPSLQPQAKSKQHPLHLFKNLRHPSSWEVGFRFTGASLANPQHPPAKQIEDVIVTFDIIYGLPSGGYMTNLNKNAKADQPIPITRGYTADLVFKTEFTPRPIRWEGARVGLRLSIDQEVFRVLSITADMVQLVSDRGFGGNGQIFDKQLQGVGPGQPVKPGIPAIPVPGGGTNAPSTNTLPARPAMAIPPTAGGQ
jgi:hypothetical protein